MLLSAQDNGNDLPERSGNEQLSEHQSFTKTSPFLPFFRPCGREKQSSGFPERVFCQEKRMLKKIIRRVPVEIKKRWPATSGGKGNDAVAGRGKEEVELVGVEPFPAYLMVLPSLTQTGIASVSSFRLQR